MDIAVHEVDPADAEHVAAVTTCRNRTYPEIDPEDPPVGCDEMRAELAASTVETRTRTWIAFADGQPAGDVCFDLDDDAHNRHVAATDWFAVVPELRRRGVADALLRDALDQLTDEGRTSLLLWGPTLEPDVAAAYATRLGLEQRTEERCSRLRLRDLDRDLVDRWLATGRARSDGYQVVQFGGHCPDEYVEPYVEACGAMEDMPTDDLDWTPQETSESLVRVREDRWRTQGHTVVRSLVMAPDGGGAGMSELFVSSFRPQLAFQGDTGVVAAHRGHGLGRWLKAENLVFAEEVAPGFEVIETYNAQSNPWMLDINVAMGFRPHMLWRGFQGDLATARTAIS